MNQLVFVQNRQEFEQVRKVLCRAENSITIVRCGDFELSELDVSDVNLVTVSDLNLDLFEIWGISKYAIDKFWEPVDGDPETSLFLAIQFDINDLIFGIMYVRSIVLKAIEQLHPDEIIIPLKTLQYRPGSSDVGFLQTVVKIVGGENGVAIAATPGEQFSIQKERARLLVGYTLRYVNIWLVDAYWKLFRILRRAFAFTKSSDTDLHGATLITNFYTDLSRQFDIDQVRNLRDIDIWVLDKGNKSISRINGESSKRKIRKLIRPSERQSLLSTLAKNCVSERFSLKSAKNKAYTSARFESVISHPEMGSLRLHFWKRLVYITYRYVEFLALARSTGIALAVCSDSNDIDRAVLLAMRAADVRTLATEHGIQFWKDSQIKVTPIAHVHALFSSQPSYYSDTKFPKLPSERVVAHDLLTDLSTPFRNDSNKKRKIIIVVSFYSGSFTYSWLNGYFVDRKKYASDFKELVQNLFSTLDGIEIIVKCHPKADLYDVYESVKQDHLDKEIEIVREPFRDGHDLRCDLVIVFNCISNLILEFARSGTPMISNWGALTTKARELFVLDELLGSENSVEVTAIADSILMTESNEHRAIALSKISDLVARSVSPALFKFNDLVTIRQLSDQKTKELFK